MMGLQTPKRIPGDGNVQEKCMKKKVFKSGHGKQWLEFQVTKRRESVIPVIVTTIGTMCINEGIVEVPSWQN